MQILAHRGFWEKADEKNSVEAFKRSLDEGFGIETDLRDQDSQIVISHDPAQGKSLLLEEFFKIYNAYGTHPMLALNIKSDGLSNQLKEILQKYKVSNYFVFDMSIPETILYLRKGLNVFIRQSEYEQPNDSLDAQSSGYWIDIFKDNWPVSKKFSEISRQKQNIAYVSPELHGRQSYLSYWDYIRNIETDKEIILCTDYPQLARTFFKGNR